MTIGSLFSGIGGLELGLERAGLGPVVWQAESDPFCRRVLARHWPDAERFSDVRHVTAEVSPVDLVCGGFPCQDISVAGTGAGLAGERSGLWSEFARVIRELRPRVVVVENVPALLVRGMGDVLGDLAASGYDAQWDCIPAQSVGAPHRRDRLFVVARRVPDAERDGVREQPERGEGPAQTTDRRDTESSHVGAELADGDRGRRQVERVAGQAGGRGEQSARGSESHGRDGQGWPPRPDDLHAWRQVQAESQPAICRVAHGIPDRVDRLRALGNAVVPQVAEFIGREL